MDSIRIIRDGLTIEEVAEQLNLTPSAVRATEQRALMKLSLYMARNNLRPEDFFRESEGLPEQRYSFTIPQNQA